MKQGDMATSTLVSGIRVRLRDYGRRLAAHPRLERLRRFFEGDPLAFEPHLVSPTVCARFRAEQLNDLGRSTPTAMLAACFSALMFAIAMWETPQAGQARIWAFAIIALAGFIYVRCVSASAPPRAAVSPRGIWRATANALLQGSLWGALPAYFFAEAAPPQQFVIACICVATLFGGGFALSMAPVAMLAHVAPITIGAGLAILANGNVAYDIVAVIILIYTIVMICAALSRAAMAARRCAAEVAAEAGALRDELTGLPNRVAFREELARSFARHARHSERFALMCMDLDGFKSVNDLMGHAAGDAVLMEAARRLRVTTREADMIARVGGDEFALIASEIRTTSDATSIAERLVAAFSEPFVVEGRNMPITLSVGVAIAPGDGVDPVSLLHNADSAMYATKQSGRCGYTFFRDRFGFVAESMTIDAELERAFEQGEFYLVFQPFVNAASLKTTGFEALLRWRHPVRGALRAAEIIPLFERSGVIDVVGAWALEEAMKIAATWPHHLRVAVNVSALQLRRPNFEKTVLDALEKSGLDPRRLELELTESTMIVDGGKAFAMLASLRHIGVRTALDDLGTGYSSLANLVGLPLDRLKIDRSFISNLETNPICASVVKLSIELARSLSLNVTAEGVEDVRQLELLRAFGCKEAQGYLFSEPRPASQIGHLMESCLIVDASAAAFAEPPPAAALVG